MISISFIKNCNEKYFGEKGRALEQELRNIKGMLIMAALTMLRFFYILEKGHSIHWDSARSIYKRSDFYKRSIIEFMIDSLHKMNISAISFRLNDFFNRIILPNIDNKC